MLSRPPSVHCSCHVVIGCAALDGAVRGCGRLNNRRIDPQVPIRFLCPLVWLYDKAPPHVDGMSLSAVCNNPPVESRSRYFYKKYLTTKLAPSINVATLSNPFGCSWALVADERPPSKSRSLALRHA